MYIKGIRKQKGCSKFSYRIHLKLPDGKEVNLEKGGFLTSEEAQTARSEKIIELTTQNCDDKTLTFEQVFNEFVKKACVDKESLEKKYYTYYTSYLKGSLGSLFIGECFNGLVVLQKKLCKSFVADGRSSTKQIHLSRPYLQGLKALLFNVFDFAYVNQYIKQHPMYALDAWAIHNNKENTNIEPLFAYLGNKYRLLPDIQALFPKNINTFVDLFGGSGIVGINSSANQIIVNENNLFLTGILKGIQRTAATDAWCLIEGIIENYVLNNENEDGYYTCRSDYNKIPYEERCINYWYWGLVLVYCSFNRSTVQFNQQREYNAPFGYGKVNFKLAKHKFFAFSYRVYNSNIIFTCEDYKEIKISQDAFVYLDPPYMITTATYNKTWTEKEEKELYEYLESLDGLGIRWAMSNVLENNGIRNTSLHDWVKSHKTYNLYYLKSNYTHANFRRKNRGRTVEVLITNY